jgi:cytochrome c-type biogenesis protein CcmH
MQRWRRLRVIVMAGFSAAMPLPALAVQPDEILPDAALEHRAREISGGLRCLVCQNQSIDDSDAPLAKDLRLIVRERLKTGDSDQAVIDYVVARYGDFVLLKPPLKPATLLLWLSPLLLLMGGAWYGVRAMRAQRPDGDRPAPLTDAERKKLKDILG